MENSLVVRKAHMDDVKSMHGLLLQCAQKGLLLPRALIHLYGHVRNFMVAENTAGEIVVCCALAPVWEDLAEICSLVVREDARRLGTGRDLVNACLSECRDLHIQKVFALTYQEAFFARLVSGLWTRIFCRKKSGPTACTAPSTPTATKQPSILNWIQLQRT